MESILITPKNEKQQSILVSLFEEMGVFFKSVEDVSEGDKFYPELEKKLNEAEKNMKNKNTLALETTDSIDDFWKKIMTDESI